MKLNSITVFCGSKSGNNPVYISTAIEMGKYFAKQNISLVYGGSNVGIMGKIADSCLEGGGKVIGIMPTFLTKIEAHHAQLTEAYFVETMHERKFMMSQLGDGFLALPGGFGTLDELFEILTWAQLGLHNKPIGILNTAGFYTPLIEMVNHMESQGFLYPGSLSRILIDENLELLIEKMENFSGNPEPSILHEEQI